MHFSLLSNVLHKFKANYSTTHWLDITGNIVVIG